MHQLHHHLHHPVANLNTICDLTRWAMSEMERNEIELGHGTADYWEEATFLVMRTLKLPFDRLESFWNAHLTPEEIETVLCNIDLRVHMKKPTPYLIQEAWLSDYSFYCDERVLIPRSYISELLKDQLEPWIEDPYSVGSVLDMCTGSGCLAILAGEAFPNAELTGADISPEALEVAQINRSRFMLDDYLELVETDLFANLQGRRFDVIISNPPYVTQEAMDELPQEYRHEPTLALEAGDDGMDIMRRMMPVLGDHLTENGIAVIEIGNGKDAFESIFPDLPVTWLTTSGGDDQVFLVTAADLKTWKGEN